MPPSRTIDELRADVREWCRTSIPEGWRHTEADASRDDFVAFQNDWLRRLDEAGWAVPHWPTEWGGGYSLAEQSVIYEELARAEAPRLVLHFISLHHAASTLLHAGTEEQRARHLPAIRAGEVWCQGFSEPGAGSDLAALATKAVRDGDDFIVNGQKIWASLAMYADWCLLLVRTDPDAPKRRGISYMLMDMRSPGVEVRPIKKATGEEHFCEIFLTDVRIPAANVIGPENDGWRVAQSTLNAERGATMVELSERLKVGFSWLWDELHDPTRDADLLSGDDAYVADQLAGYATELEALRLLVARGLADDIAPHNAGVLASVTKLLYSELLQNMTGFGTSLAGLDGQLRMPRVASGGWESGVWLLDHISSWEWTIPGGTSEIQRTIIGERGLGLPREPR
ncbi:acyl-CoA dehydrogenase family protein [Microbacterium sp. zg.Y625]|uniref:acyl-CoA dehydrogenase family protein n=1 Tax=Microbacterium jiangjiandongii TaxID=3049071 RepID=UPI00214CF210|nr:MULTISPECIES: acyl-CoA dehydrogenase family protein [unclassified Microbacterium]MCR2793471.1 acyl-CoA dehydrogenase family protein [Microbacterium sp. zg.Y625]MCR2815351.1 acyl-CoA dehydrogenase family protein [Microbacterium sp. zg.Y843]WIM25159.1 acyl-CoA dehydrogenase family protein [Microbacterium sp. zg-Y625]